MSLDAIDFERLASDGIRGLRAYDPGHDLVALRHRFGAQGLLELGSNENPYGPSPRVRDVVLAALDSLHIYPDPLGGELKRALATKHGVAMDCILLGNGSHELLMQFAQVFSGPGSDVVAAQYGFSVYALAAQAAGARFVAAPALPRDHAMPRGHDLDAIAAAIAPSTRLVYLANPNNPTGTWFDRDALAGFLQRTPADVLVVIDEAYAELADAPDYASALSMLDRHPNLIITRTFSKAYALAGLRIGYAVAHPGLVAVMERVRESFNVNSVGLAAAAAALADEAYLQATSAYNARERDALADALRQRGIFVYPSQTNFLLAEFGPRSIELERELVVRGVVLRPMAGYGLAECLRISVGDAAGNKRLLQALDEVL
ncbi:histidinol-phosphate aminotransferase [Luteimonas cucumeris]|uniref:Histidinol-phosphate aminotransferase n=1 Tax=Luteimonas cucumeris TaxID=985012 RepID=A0A562L8D3_9GAMM|nr:histidinol-phosphate transaminase [Luteimonas cucumeris]TWI03919.1 histidinol-phosphate aminotransferase [Luteimonas cucumeris]